MAGLLCILSFIFAFMDSSEHWWIWLISCVLFGIIHYWKENK